MGKCVWKMPHTVAQSWNITRKLYNEETWPANQKMQSIFSQSKYYVEVFHRIYALGLVLDV